MKFIVIVFAVVVVAEAARRKNVNKRQYDGDYEHAAELAAAQHGLDDKGYSAGSGLRSIAQGSADQANSAVANQHAAGIQAAYVAKSTLAQSAIQAAATAQAALAGREVLLNSLENQNLEAHHMLEAEIAQLQLSKRTAAAAKQAAQQASHHVSVLTATLNGAQTVLEKIEIVAQEAANELAAQTSMVGKAKAHLESIEEQMHSARLDFEATREAAEKATSAAQEAQNNAASAGAHATVELHDSNSNNNAPSHQGIAYVSGEIATNQYHH